MQTFLPYPDFERSAAVLDDKRLGKQRVETLQVVRALTFPTYGWKNHPAVRMWRGHTEALGCYGAVICRIWVDRGFSDTVAEKLHVDLAAVGIATPVRTQAELAAAGALPPWLGDDAVHSSHRAALLRKDPEFYGRRFADDSPVDPESPYVWPVGPPAAETNSRDVA